MYTNPTSSGRRETITTIALAILFGGGIFLFALLLLGEILVATLAAVAAMTLVGCLHYFIWGRSLASSTGAEKWSARNGMPERWPPRE